MNRSGGLLVLCVCLSGVPVLGHPALTADAIIRLAQAQHMVPSEFAWGEMRIYRGERLHRTYTFVLGKRWEDEAQTESIRIDFTTPADDGLYTDRRYLLRRAGDKPATQWLYIPALRRVRIVPYQPDDPLLQSDQLFYDLTTIQNFADYAYHFLEADPARPVIQGRPRLPLVPYHTAVFSLERRGETYLVTDITYTADGEEKHAQLSGFIEVVPGRYRPQKLTVSTASSRTELRFGHWVIRPAEAQLFTPTQLETLRLTVPVDR